MRRQIENDEEKKTVGNYVMGYIDGKYMIIRRRNIWVLQRKSRQSGRINERHGDRRMKLKREIKMPECMTDKIEIGLHIMKVANKPINILEELSEREAGTSNEIAI